MDFEQAQTILDDTLQPMTMESFLTTVVGKHVQKIAGAPDLSRVGLLGPEPERTLLNAFDTLAAKITCHAGEPRGLPPAAEPVSSADSFRTKIAEFHTLGYTVRLNGVRGLSAPLDRLLRALETVLHQPLEAQAFWSDGDAKAPVHHDDFDVMAIQLVGRKRWYISSGPPELLNAWPSIPTGSLELGPHQEIDLAPGDIVYLPRGTRHRVDAHTESIHLSIGFVPLTMREAMIAMLDHMSDLERPYRVSIAPVLAAPVNRNDFGDLPSALRQGFSRLLRACDSAEFVAQAMQRRSSRVISAFASLESPERHSAISNTTRLRRSELAISHLISNGQNIDFAYPGGHLYIHAGAAQSVEFIARMQEFSVADIPGPLDERARIALVLRFVSIGFLEVVSG
jgi:hypothetical protein